MRLNYQRSEVYNQHSKGRIKQRKAKAVRFIKFLWNRDWFFEKKDNLNAKYGESHQSRKNFIIWWINQSLEK